MKKVFFTVLILLSYLISYSQDKIQSGSSYLQINSSGDVYLNNPNRSSDGRALVAFENDVLFINYGNDFAGGTRIGSQANFINYGLVLGNRISTSDFGEVTRLTITPYYHTGGPWRIVSRDTSSSSFIDFVMVQHLL